MKNFLQYIVITMLLVGSLQAKELTDTKDLTPSTVLSYLPPMPEYQRNSIYAWKNNPQNKNLLNQLKSVTSFRTDYWDKTKLLHLHGFKNMNTIGNFVFEIPNANFVAKLTGTSNKRFNFTANNPQDINKVNNVIIPMFYNKQPGSPEYNKVVNEAWNPFWDEQYEKYKKNPLPFYQGISRAERHLLLKKAIKDHNLTAIQLPDLFLVPYDDTKLSPVNDETYFVVERAPYADLLDFTNKERFQKIPPETIRQMLWAAKEGYLWDLVTGQIGLMNDNKTLVLYDLEQGNRLSIDCAFGPIKCPKDYESSGLTGIRDFLLNVKKYGTPAQFQAGLKYIQEDPRLKDEPELKNFWEYQNIIQDEFPELSKTK